MNDMWKTKKPLNNKPLYIGIAVAVLVIMIGGGIDASHMFGKEGTLPIQITSTFVSGFVLAASYICANTRMTIKELIC